MGFRCASSACRTRQVDPLQRSDADRSCASRELHVLNHRANTGDVAVPDRASTDGGDRQIGRERPDAVTFVDIAGLVRAPPRARGYGKQSRQHSRSRRHRAMAPPSRTRRRAVEGASTARRRGGGWTELMLATSRARAARRPSKAHAERGKEAGKRWSSCRLRSTFCARANCAPRMGRREDRPPQALNLLTSKRVLFVCMSTRFGGQRQRNVARGRGAGG